MIDPIYFSKPPWLNDAPMQLPPDTDEFVVGMFATAAIVVLLGAGLMWALGL